MGVWRQRARIGLYLPALRRSAVQPMKRASAPAQRPAGKILELAISDLLLNGR